MPRGATAIDFAYAVHTDVGNSAVGAKINGRIAPLISELHNGDEVLISRAEGGSPPAAWDGVVVTGRARAAIRRATREAAKAQFGGLGRQIVERAFERAGKKFAEAKLKAALPRLARASIDDVFIGVGRGEIFSTDVVRAVYPDFKEERKAGPAVPPERERLVRLAQGGRSRVPRAGRSPTRQARCRCAASISIRRCASRRRAGRCRASASSAFARPRASSFIRSTRRRSSTTTIGPSCGWTCAGTWRTRRTALYSTQVVVTLLNEPGALGVIATTIGEYGANIDAISSSANGADFRELRVDLQVRDIQHLNAILSELRGKSVGPQGRAAERIGGRCRFTSPTAPT